MWSHDNVIPPNSFAMALKWLYTTERKIFDSDKEEEYKKAIMDFGYKGYEWKLTKEDAEKVGPRACYLPHFCMHNINKPNKMRLVFDAAADFFKQPIANGTRRKPITT